MRLERDYLRDLLVFGRPVHLSCGESLAVDAHCSRHPNGTGIILNIQDLEFIIPRDRFERVARAEVPGLIVRPTRSDRCLTPPAVPSSVSSARSCQTRKEKSSARKPTVQQPTRCPKSAMPPGAVRSSTGQAGFQREKSRSNPGVFT